MFSGFTGGNNDYVNKGRRGGGVHPRMPTLWEGLGSVRGREAGCSQPALLRAPPLSGALAECPWGLRQGHPGRLGQRQVGLSGQKRRCPSPRDLAPTP